MKRPVHWLINIWWYGGVVVFKYGAIKYYLLPCYYYAVLQYDGREVRQIFFAVSHIFQIFCKIQDWKCSPNNANIYLGLSVYLKIGLDIGSTIFKVYPYIQMSQLFS